MERVTRFARLAVGVALIGAITSAGWSQENPKPRPATDDGRIFARVDSYLHLNVQSMEKRYLASLDYPSQGVVEAAVREITRVKLAHPSSSMKPVEEKFKELASEGETLAIRYKSMLGLQVFENPDLFLDLAGRAFNTEDEMFTAISRRLEKSLLAGRL